MANFHIGSATPVTRKAMDSSSAQCAGKFWGSITSRLFICHQHWDSVLGENGI